MQIDTLIDYMLLTHIDKFLIATFTQVSEKGIDATLTKKNIKELYNKYCVRMEN